VALSYFTFVKPDMAAGVAIVSLIGAALTLLCGRALVHRSRQESTISRVIGCGFLFKSINDTHGHATGDAVLKGFVATAGGQPRAQDMLGRYGGEEFLIVLPDTAREQAIAAAERRRAPFPRSCWTWERNGCASRSVSASRSSAR